MERGWQKDGEQRPAAEDEQLIMVGGHTPGQRRMDAGAHGCPDADGWVVELHWHWRAMTGQRDRGHIFFCACRRIQALGLSRVLRVANLRNWTVPSALNLSRVFLALDQHLLRSKEAMFFFLQQSLPTDTRF